MKHSTHNMLMSMAVAVLTVAAMPVMAETTAAIPAEEVAAVPSFDEDPAATPNITVKESTLHITNADNMILEIYSITGRRVYAAKIDSPSKTFELSSLPHACYIVKIGKFVRKVFLS